MSGDGEPAAEPPRCAECGALVPEAEEGDEPLTHCEWCGAEYPVPGGG